MNRTTISNISNAAPRTAPRVRPQLWQRALPRPTRATRATRAASTACPATPVSVAEPPVGIRAEADPSPFARDVVAGLAAPHKRIGGQWLHDERGQRLFDAVTRTPQFYLPHIEQQLVARCAGEIAALAGPAATLVEAGAAESARLLLAALDKPARQLRITAPAAALPAQAGALGQRAAPGRCVIYLSAVTVGRCSAEELAQLLADLHASAGAEALLVLGADATIDPDRLLPAYDDPQGQNAAFNINLLGRMQRELAADLDPDTFRHAARWDSRQRRMEMHLVSRRDQQVRVAGQRFSFMQGESIVTELAHKPSALRVCSLAWHAGWSLQQLWGDAHGGVALHVFAAREP
jgi:uncharacterized SAM-dependent methyltransferase